MSAGVEERHANFTIPSTSKPNRQQARPGCCNPVKKPGPVSLDHVLSALRETKEERDSRIRALFSFFDSNNGEYLMAFRAAAYWKSMARNLTTSSSPRLKAYAPAADQFRLSQERVKSLSRKGDFVPVFVALGMIGLSAGFGAYTIYHQLARNPNVSVKKSRRETIPEVVEPEHVAQEAEKFVKGSFFRKVAHIQDFDRQEVMADPIRGDVFSRPQRVETLKDVGVDPKPN